jgi:predicted transcriptional regulator
MKRSGIGEDLEAVIRGERMMEASGMERKAIILSYLSERPCSTSYAIANALNISERGALWHFRSMEKREIIGETELDGKRRFFITDHIKNEHCRIFSILSEKRLRGILIMVVESPGISSSEISDKLDVTRQASWKLVKKLLKSGLIKEVKDGRKTRYYPSETLREMESIYAERRESTAYLIEMDIKKIGFAPAVITHRNGMLHLKVGEKEMAFSTDPFRSALEG